MKNQIKIKICGREYTLNADPKDEYLLKKAADVLNDKIGQNKERGISSTPDLLAIAAFDAVVDSLRLSKEMEDVAKRLDTINGVLLTAKEDRDL